jgi:ABC-type bacteriocin/lantibiotic exporter with double-glycine peptidase domain
MVAISQDQTEPRRSLLKRLFDVFLHALWPQRWATPTVLQMEAQECGAASLAMILAHYGRWVPLEALRLDCGVSRDGSKASNVLKAAKRYGMAAKGFRKEPSTLHELPLPAIIHWNFNHFLVLERLDRNHAWINDPASGRRRVDYAEFDTSFTGVVLAMEPTAEFLRGGSKPRFMPLLLRRLDHSLPAIGLLFAVSFVLAVPIVLIPALTKIFIDGVLVQHNSGWFTPLLIGMAIAAVMRLLMEMFQKLLLFRLETKLTVTMVSRFLWHVLTLPMEFFSQRHAGDIVSRVGSNEQIAQMLSNGIASNALNLVALILIAINMAFYDLTLTAIGIGTLLFNAVMLRLVVRKREEVNRKLALDRGKLDASTVEIIRTIETIKAGGLEDDAFARWAGFHAKVLNSEQVLGVYSSFLDLCPVLLTGLAVAAVFGVGGLRIVDGALTIGGLVALQTLLASLVEPVNALMQQAGVFQTIQGSLLRIEDVFNYPARPLVTIDAAPAAMPPKLSGRVELKDVSFGYSQQVDARPIGRRAL